MAKINKKLKVLIVDDSQFMQQFISKKLNEDPSIEICALASDPFEARDKILSADPDVIVLDINMPRMNGIEFVRRLLPQYPLPIVVISSNRGLKEEALEAGAIAFVAKAESGDANVFIEALKVKVKLAPLIFRTPNKNKIQKDYNLSKKVIAIGASTGGTEATSAILSQLKKDLPCILIVQHMPEGFTSMYADRLRDQYSLDVKEAEDGDLVTPGMIYVARGMRHMEIVKGERGNKIRVFEGEKVNSHCPAIDVLFDSVAMRYGKDAMGILLTGMGKDGAKGLLKMREEGAFTIAQDEKSSVVYGMPKAAMAIGAAEKQYTPQEIPKVIYEWVKK